MSDLSFTAIINDADISGLTKSFGLPELDAYTGKPTVKIDFHLEIEARSWGIKGIVVVIDNIAASIEWAIYEEDCNEAEQQKLIILHGGTPMRNGMIEGTIGLDTKTEPFSLWTIDNDVIFEDDGAASISNVEIDFESKSIIIN